MQATGFMGKIDIAGVRLYREAHKYVCHLFPGSDCLHQSRPGIVVACDAILCRTTRRHSGRHPVLTQMLTAQSNGKLYAWAGTRRVQRYSASPVC